MSDATSASIAAFISGSLMNQLASIFRIIVTGAKAPPNIFGRSSR